MEYRKREKITALSILVGALLVQFFVLPNFIDHTEEYDLASLSPDFFPSLAVWLITALAGVYLFYAFYDKKKSAGPGATWLSSGEMKKALLCCLIIIVYFIAIKFFGFLAATIPVLFVLFLIQGVKGPVRMVCISLASTIGIYLFFVFVLKVQFPQGILFE